MEDKELRAWIEREIKGCLPFIGGVLSEQADHFFKSQAFALIDALDVMNEVEDREAYCRRIREMYRGSQGTQRGFKDLLDKLGVAPE